MINPLVCIYEDRSEYTVAAKLLILSLHEFHPELRVLMRFPAAPEEFIRWCEEKPQVTLAREYLEGAGSYNIKPHVLLDGLNTGASACLWLDTDIILNGNLSWFANCSNDMFVSTLDPYSYTNGSTYRAEAFGLKAQPIGIPGAINSAVVLVQQCHRDLLTDWGVLLKRPEYLFAQTQPVASRNPMMLGDQDALSALIASEKYGHLKVHLLKHPEDILHHQGAGALSFGKRIRFKRMEHLPPLLHAMASIKPWVMKTKLASDGFFKKSYYAAFLETSPYVCVAKKYKKYLSEDTSWLQPTNKYSKLMINIFKNNAVAAGALQSLVHTLITFMRRNKA